MNLLFSSPMNIGLSGKIINIDKKIFACQKS